MRDPGGVLGEIIARKRLDVAARLGSVSAADLRARAAPSRRRLRDALSRPGARFVMEVKRASPSEGALRSEADPTALARAYAGAADAISVLTDEPYFGGSLADLGAVRAAFDGPVLAKDFVIDVRQVVEARLHGADAVLVMLSVLDDDEALAVMAEASRLEMDCLVEAHDEAELRRAEALGANIIGINNRDLRSLKVDLATTERLAPLAPANCVLVAESGIGARGDVARLAPLVHSFLVGSSLMRAASPALAARDLAFGRVKVCGLTNSEDAAAACRAGASFAGAIAAPESPRAVDAAQAEAVAEAAHAGGARAVMVFRNAAQARVADLARALDLDAVQLHGAEDDIYVAELRRLLPEQTEIWRAIGVADAPPSTQTNADRIVYDAQIGGRSGGTGVAFDWRNIAGKADLDRALLAGGLNPANARAASRVGAYALDVGSGVEAAPGRKDADKLAAFFTALRPETRGAAAPC